MPAIHRLCSQITTKNFVDNVNVGITTDIHVPTNDLGLEGRGCAANIPDHDLAMAGGDHAHVLGCLHYR